MCIVLTKSRQSIDNHPAVTVSKFPQMFSDSFNHVCSTNVIRWGRGHVSILENLFNYNIKIKMKLATIAYLAICSSVIINDKTKHNQLLLLVHKQEKDMN